MLQPEEALNRIIEGNKRFAKGMSIHPNLGTELRNSLVNAQKPIAAILSCSDSRVPVEIILDMGLGDIFVIRNAGNVISKTVLGSLEYAVESLGVKLVMILGHGNCGAVNSALKNYQEKNINSELDNMSYIFNQIYPAFENLDFEQDNELIIRNAIIANINNQAKNLLAKSTSIAEKVNNNEIMLVGAKYCLASGLIEVLDECKNNLHI